MGNRSRFTIVAGAAIGIAGVGAARRARRRARFRAAVAGMGDAITVPAGPPSPMVVSDEAHAPGHRHLPPPPGEWPPPDRGRPRPVGTRRRGVRHQSRG